jgi:hypothetical protein
MQRARNIEAKQIRAILYVLDRWSCISVIEAFYQRSSKQFAKNELVFGKANFQQRKYDETSSLNFYT